MTKYEKGYPCTYGISKEREIVNHFDESKYLQRVSGKLYGVIEMIAEKEHSCKEMLNQLLGASAECRRIAAHILARHIQHCLKEEGFPGDDNMRDDELKKALNYMPKVGLKENFIREKIEDMLEM